MPSEEINYGDVVLLKSDSIKMTIEGIFENEYGSISHFDCVYCNPVSGLIERITLAPHAVKKHIAD